MFPYTELGVEAVKKKIADNVLEGALNRSSKVTDAAPVSMTLMTSYPPTPSGRINILSPSVKASLQDARHCPL